MIHTYEQNVGDALESLTRRVALMDLVHPGGGGAQIYDVVVTAESLDWDYDLADSWVTRQRWTMLTKQYVNEKALDHWLDLIDSKMTSPRSHGVAFMRSQLVKPRGSSRRWGSCMLGWSFRRSPKPTLTMHSRSTYLGFVAPLDVGVAIALADLIGERLGLALEDISFTWYIEQVTFHGFRSMPWWYLDSAHEQLLKASQTEAARRSRHIITRYQKLDAQEVTYAEQPYAQERRSRMRWHQVTGIDPTPFLGDGVTALPKLRSIMLSDLELSPATVEESEEVDYEGFDE